MNAHAYLRVSSKAQNHATQWSTIERASSARGDTIAPEAVYSEKRSAKSMKRPELDRVRADARAGRIKRLYVFKYDRLCRTGVRDLLNILHELRECGVEVVAVADVIDLNGPAAEMLLAALAFAAKLEREAINDRISAARERVEGEGGKWGRPPRLTDGEVARVRRLRDEGRSLREIAVALKIPRSTVARAASVPKTRPDDAA